jgi:hypothetical protein
MISREDFFWFADDALDAMVDIVSGLGDDLANRAPELPGANSPYAILTHCLGVIGYWGGQVIAGRDIDRDRAAEFVARGEVAELAARTRQVRRQLAHDLVEFDPAAPPRGEVRGKDADLPLGRTQGGALFHVYEELAQHRGQLEITRDVLRSA